MKSTVALLAITFIILTYNSFGVGNPNESFVDKQVAGLIVGEDGIEKLLQLYGPGFSLETPHGKTICYYSANDKAYFRVTLHDGIIESVILTRQIETKEVDDCKKTIIRGKTLMTGKGIKLGDSLQKIIKTYGEPGKKGFEGGTLTFEYHTDSKKDPEVKLFYDAYLYFHENKLIKLVIHDGE